MFLIDLELGWKGDVLLIGTLRHCKKDFPRERQRQRHKRQRHRDRHTETKTEEGRREGERKRGGTEIKHKVEEWTH